MTATADDIGQSVANATGVRSINDGISLATNLFSLGLVGYGENGLEAGVTTRAAQDGVKEITGVKAQEEALKLQKDQLKIAREEQDKARRDTIEARRQQDLAASNAAGAMATGSKSFYTGVNPEDLLGV